MARIPMSFKELKEGRRVGIPESIIGKMAIGIEPSEREKEIINKLGKAYVEAHKKDGKWVKPHLRDLPGDSGVKRRNDKYSDRRRISDIHSVSELTFDENNWSEMYRIKEKSGTELYRRLADLIDVDLEGVKVGPGSEIVPRGYDTPQITPNKLREYMNDQNAPIWVFHRKYPDRNLMSHTMYVAYGEDGSSAVIRVKKHGR